MFTYYNRRLGRNVNKGASLCVDVVKQDEKQRMRTESWCWRYQKTGINKI